MHTGHWDPFLAACEETETVVCLHTGSSLVDRRVPSPGAPLETHTTLFPVNGAGRLPPTWLWARIPVRFPRLRIALSEGGIGWVPMLLDRLDYVLGALGVGRRGRSGTGDLAAQRGAAAQLLVLHDRRSRRRSALRERDRRRSHLVESDYPHADSTWPDTQELLARRRRADCRRPTSRKITHRERGAAVPAPAAVAEWQLPRRRS